MKKRVKAKRKVGKEKTRTARAAPVKDKNEKQETDYIVKIRKELAERVQKTADRSGKTPDEMAQIFIGRALDWQSFELAGAPFTLDYVKLARMVSEDIGKRLMRSFNSPVFQTLLGE